LIDYITAKTRAAKGVSRIRPKHGTLGGAGFAA
jgi:hypothetical protein